MPFLTVITRTIPRRVELLDENQRSLARQYDQDYEQIVIVDEEERGVAWANGMMAERDWSEIIDGEYVMILDDDDRLAHPHVIAELKMMAAGKDLLVVRMDHGPRGILPNPLEDIRRARIGCSAVIPRREVFLKAVKHYEPAYDGDFDYIEACLQYARTSTRLDYIASEVMQIGAVTER